MMRAFARARPPWSARLCDRVFIARHATAGAPTGGGNTCDIVDISRVFQGDDELVSREQAQLTVVGSGFRGCSLPVQACGVGSCSRMCGASGALLAWRAMLCFLLPLRLSALASAPVLGEVVALEEGGR